MTFFNLRSILVRKPFNQTNIKYILITKLLHYNPLKNMKKKAKAVRKGLNRSQPYSDTELLIERPNK